MGVVSSEEDECFRKGIARSKFASAEQVAPEVLPVVVVPLAAELILHVWESQPNSFMVHVFSSSSVLFKVSRDTSLASFCWKLIELNFCWYILQK